MRFGLLCFAASIFACQTGSPKAGAKTEADLTAATGKTTSAGATTVAATDRDSAEQAAAGSDAYRADFDNLCHSETRSGADESDNPRPVAIAMWLGDTIKTREAQDFLATFSRTPPAAKAALLEAERVRLGLADCPLVRTWSASTE